MRLARRKLLLGASALVAAARLGLRVDPAAAAIDATTYQRALRYPTFARGFGTTSGSGTDFVSFGAADPLGSTQPWSAYVLYKLDTSIADMTFVNKRDGFTNGQIQFYFGVESGQLMFEVAAANNGGNSIYGGTAGPTNVAASTIWQAAMVACDSAGATMCNTYDINGLPIGNLVQITSLAGDFRTGAGASATLTIGRLTTEGIRQMQGLIALVMLWKGALNIGTCLELVRAPISGKFPTNMPNPVFTWAPGDADAKDIDLVGGVVGTRTGTSTTAIAQVLGKSRRAFMLNPPNAVPTPGTVMFRGMPP